MLLPVLLLWTLVAGEEGHPDPSWGNSCPVPCSCHLGHLGDLPISQWLQREEMHVSKPRISLPMTNEAFYEEDTDDDATVFHSRRGSLLKIVMCIFQSASDPQKLFNEIPKDTQALTLLQSRGSEEITLEAEHMKHFQELLYFEIQGYCPEVWKEESNEHKVEHNFLLSNDALKPITSLQYLSLQHVKLLGSSIKSNEIDHEGYSHPQLEPNQNEISINLQTESEDKIRRLKPRSSNLVILKPTGIEGELVPYQIYKEQQERARLSIFAKLFNLVLLRVVDCGLHEVYWEMFEGLRKLEHLSLEKNQLLFLPEFAFYGTPNLKTLSLAHNKLLNIHSTGLAGLLDLQKLDLSYNNFSHLSEFSLPPFPNLKEAYFWHNPIEAVFASTFEIMNATTVLYLGGNNASLMLHPNSFQGLNHLKKLVLYNVGIEVFERELLSGMSQLRYLKLSGTISSISFDAFLDAPLLENLDLQHCNIRSLSMDAFYGLYRLLVLDLSNNLLQVLPPGVFDQQFSLKELFLQNNSLTELPDGFFTSLTAKMVRLEGNLWHCTCNMKGWLASATNRVKEMKTERSTNENDKGVGNTTPLQSISYVYEKKVAPRCATPSEYKGWSVYHVLRRELRCSKQTHKKFNQKEYLKRKYKEYERNNMLNLKQNIEPSEIKHIISERTNTGGNLNIFDNTVMNMLPNDVSNFTAPTQSSPAEIHFTTKISHEHNNTGSLNNTNEQEILEKAVPLIYSTQHSQTQVHPNSDKLLPLIQDIHLAADTKGKPGKGLLGKPNVIKSPMHGETQEVKFLKKLWKTELQRKYQEKMKNQTRNLDNQKIISFS